MTAAPTAYHRPIRSARAWSRDLAQAPRAAEYPISCSCGLVVKATRPLEEETGFLFNAGWRAEKNALRCPECAAGVRRRVVIGSQGDQYVLRQVAGVWRCTCRGYTHHGHCKHAKALNAESLAAAASQYVDEALAGTELHAADFVAWLRGDCGVVTTDTANAALAAALEDYRRVCVACNGQGGHTHHVGGWHQPEVDESRCDDCDGEGYLEPPFLAPLTDAMPVAAE